MEGKFRVRREPCTCRSCGLARGWHWAWECTMCQPPCRGRRHGPEAWMRIFSSSLPLHLINRGSHHRIIAEYRTRHLRRRTA